MRKTISILIVIILFILTGCSNKDVIKRNYSYKGENEFWVAEYTVNYTGIFIEKNNKTEYKPYFNNILTVTYKKNLSDLSSVKHLEISYETNAGGGKLTEDHDSNNPLSQKTYTFMPGGEITEDKNEIIKVNISLDGKIQTIELKYVQ